MRSLLRLVLESGLAGRAMVVWTTAGLLEEDGGLAESVKVERRGRPEYESKRSDDDVVVVAEARGVTKVVEDMGMTPPLDRGEA